MTALAVWLATTAAAQEQPPEVNAEHYRPAVDAHDAFATAPTSSNASTHARAEAIWLHDPLRHRAADGTITRTLAEAIGLNLSAAGSIGPLRLGVTAPAWLITTGAATQGSITVLGDPSIDLRLSLLEPSPVGLALLARGGTSLGADARQLGAGGPFAEVGLAAEVGAGRIALRLNGGYRATPSQALGERSLDDQAWLRAASILDVGETTHLSVELLGDLPVVAAFDPTTFPVEVIGGVHTHVAEGIALRGGVGAPIGVGVGTPALRVVAGVSWHD